MAEDTPVQAPESVPEAPVAAAAPVEAAPPSSPPVSESAPGPSQDSEDQRATPQEGVWRAMLDRMSSGDTEGVISRVTEKPEPGEGRPKPAPAPRPKPPEPVPVPVRKWADRYDTPEALETAYQDIEQARQRAETERQRAQAQSERLERLLMSTLQGGQRPEGAGQAPSAPQQPSQDLQQALDLIRKESELLALGDPQADPLSLIRAVAAASRLDQEARRYYADLALREYSTHNQAAQQIKDAQDEFFRQFPDLKNARPTLLRQVALETETRLRQVRDDYGSPAYIQEWFKETAKEARASIKLGDGAAAAAAAPASRAATSSAGQPASSGRAAPREAKGAPFAESPTPRSTEPALTGQDVHLARVFGRMP